MTNRAKREKGQILVFLSLSCPAMGASVFSNDSQTFLRRTFMFFFVVCPTLPCANGWSARCVRGKPSQQCFKHLQHFFFFLFVRNLLRRGSACSKLILLTYRSNHHSKDIKNTSFRKKCTKVPSTLGTKQLTEKDRKDQAK